MFGRKKKLTNLSKIDLAELIERTKLIQEHILITQALELQKNIWVNGCLKRLGLDIDKRYNIDPKTGAITEVKEPVQNEPERNKTTS